MTTIRLPQEKEDRTPERAIVAVLAAFLALVLALLFLLVLSLAYTGPDGPQAAGVPALRPSSVPPQYLGLVERAGQECPDITPPVIAAQIQEESGWNPDAVSPVGALGISQFMPYTWPQWGRNDDGTGNVSPLNPADAIMAQGRYDCALAAQMTRYRNDGLVSGNILSLTLAAYNTGPGNVLLAGGPPADTVPYYSAIESIADGTYALVP